MVGLVPCLAPARFGDRLSSQGGFHRPVSWAWGALFEWCHVWVRQGSEQNRASMRWPSRGLEQLLHRRPFPYSATSKRASASDPAKRSAISNEAVGSWCCRGTSLKGFTVSVAVGKFSRSSAPGLALLPSLWALSAICRHLATRSFVGFCWALMRTTPLVDSPIRGGRCGHCGCWLDRPRCGG